MTDFDDLEGKVASAAPATPGAQPDEQSLDDKLRAGVGPANPLEQRIAAAAPAVPGASSEPGTEDQESEIVGSSVQAEFSLSPDIPGADLGSSEIITTAMLEGARLMDTDKVLELTTLAQFFDTYGVVPLPDDVLSLKPLMLYYLAHSLPQEVHPSRVKGVVSYGRKAVHHPATGQLVKPNWRFLLYIDALDTDPLVVNIQESTGLRDSYALSQEPIK